MSWCEAQESPCWTLRRKPLSAGLSFEFIPHVAVKDIPRARGQALPQGTVPTPFSRALTGMLREIHPSGLGVWQPVSILSSPDRLLCSSESCMAGRTRGWASLPILLIQRWNSGGLPDDALGMTLQDLPVVAGQDDPSTFLDPVEGP